MYLPGLEPEMQFHIGHMLSLKDFTFISCRVNLIKFFGIYFYNILLLHILSYIAANFKRVLS